MKKKISFRIIGERHDDMWSNGVKLGVKELLIYLVKHYRLDENARATGCEIAITVDGANLDDCCTHVMCEFKRMDKDARDPLVVDKLDPLKRGKLFFDRCSQKRTHSRLRL
jgi:hypothetical protein